MAMDKLYDVPHIITELKIEAEWLDDWTLNKGVTVGKVIMDAMALQNTAKLLRLAAQILQDDVDAYAKERSKSIYGRFGKVGEEDN